MEQENAVVENEGSEEASMPGTGATMVPGPNSGENKQQPQSNAEKAIAKRAFRIKAGDEEKTLELDEKEQEDYINKGYGADKKFWEATQLKRQAQEELDRIKEFRQRLKKDPFATMSEDEELKEVDLDTLSERRLAAKLERAMMSEEERELSDFRREKEERTKQEAKDKADAAAKQEQEAKEQRIAVAKDKIAGQISQVLKAGALPQTPRTVARIAAYIEGCKRQKINYSLESIIDHVKNDYQTEFQTLYGNVEVEKIAEMLGEEVISKIRKWDNERVVGKRKLATNGQTPPRAPAQQKKKWRTPEQDNLEKHGHLYPHLFNDD